MDYRQFMHLMEPGKESGKEAIHTLQDFVNEFPYFQTAHLLLAKNMHEQQHVRYEKQLKIAAAYAGDRKSLYNLIHPAKKIIAVEHIPFAESPFDTDTLEEEIVSENIVIGEEKEIIVHAVEENNFVFRSTYVDENTSTVNFTDDYNYSEIETDDFDEPPVADPHDIIRKRLIEILGLNDDKKENLITEGVFPKSKNKIQEVAEQSSVDSSEIKTESTEEKNISKSEERKDKDLIEKLVEESAKAVDFIQTAEIEYALESSFVQSLEKLPLIEPQKPDFKIQHETVQSKEKTFYEWLKAKSVVGYGVIEEVHAYEEVVVAIETPLEIEPQQEKKSDDYNLLIEKFILADPKIIPSKTEFYSPASQAKKSITENEDLVSETLAKIYHQQGNLLKARLSYEKLSLFYPEKMAYFAALISEIDKDISNQDKQN